MAVGNPWAPPPIPVLTRPDVGLIPTESAALAAQQSFLSQQIQGLPGMYNPQRQRMAQQAARSLTDQGLYEQAAPRVAARQGGSESYALGGQYEGSAFRNARTQARARAAASGVAGSSNLRRQMAGDQKALINQRQAFERDFSNQQFQSLQAQQQAQQQLGGQLQGAIGQQADFGAQAALQKSETLRDASNAQAQLNYQGAQTAQQYGQAQESFMEQQRQFEAQQKFQADQAAIAKAQFEAQQGANRTSSQIGVLTATGDYNAAKALAGLP